MPLRLLPLHYGALETSRHHSCLLTVCRMTNGRAAGQIDRLTLWQKQILRKESGFSDHPHMRNFRQHGAHPDKEKLLQFTLY